MRETKFRVWYPKAMCIKKGANGELLKSKDGKYICEERSYYDYDPVIDNYGVLLVEGGWDIAGQDDREHIVEQYTGLKDKNGKEIYEGDILQDESNDAAVVIWREHQAEWGIKWIHMGIEDSLSHRMEWGHLNEIIGNIHENPELLKKEK